MPTPETLVTVDELRRRLPADSTLLVMIDSRPTGRTALDSLPSSEVVSALLARFDYDCRRPEGCRVLLVERCMDRSGRGRRSRPECPWVVSQPWDNRLRT